MLVNKNIRQMRRCMHLYFQYNSLYAYVTAVLFHVRPVMKLFLTHSL